jgi:hypothetical protein
MRHQNMMLAQHNIQIEREDVAILRSLYLSLFMIIETIPHNIEPIAPVMEIMIKPKI